MTLQASGPCPARIMIVGEFPTQEEVIKGFPFAGAAGDELSRMLKDAGIYRSECFMTMALKTRPVAGKLENVIAETKAAITNSHVLLRDKFCLPVVIQSMEVLKREVEMCQPNVIIACGNLAMWMLTGEWGVGSWRSSIMECDLQLNLDYKPKVIPTYAPYTITRQWSWRPIMVHDLKRAKNESLFRSINRVEYDFILRADFATTVDVLSQLIARADSQPLKLAVDLETRAGHIACCGIAWTTRNAICIPLMCVERPGGYWDLQEESHIVFLLYKLLTHKNVKVVGQNFSYDAQYTYRHWHFIPNLARDTMLAQHVLFSNMPKSLDYLSSMYCAYHCYWKDDGKDWNPKIAEDQLWEYNCKDAVITFEVDEAQQTVVDQMGLREVHDFQQRLFWPVLHSMFLGLRVDTQKRAEFSLQLLDEISSREAWFYNVLGYQLNPRSSPQMKSLFYEEIGMKEIRNRKTGNVSCDDEALHKLAEREPIIKPLVNKILEYRSLGVFNSTFVQAPLDVDGRMRCSFNIGGTETYRFSSSKNAFGSGMNLQNIPKGGDTEDGLELPNIRSLFIPDPGMRYFDIDLSSADLRIVVWEADEPEMKAMLKAGLDPYTEIAKEFYNDPTINKKDPRRQTFKSFAHGTNYLGTADGLAGRLGLSIEAARRTQEWYFKRFPKIKQWQERLIDQVYKRRMVQNVFGYRCYFFDRIEGTIFNQAAAWIPQSTVACLINRAYVKIYEELKDVQILLQVHDSLAGQFPLSKPELADSIVKLAEIELPYAGDPLIIPVGIKVSDKSWGDCD